MGFTRFMASTTGRVLRVVVGIVLIAGGIALGSVLGIVLALVGLLPLGTGAFDVCIISPAFKAPIRGSEVRSH